jgi:hypothetical protein
MTSIDDVIGWNDRDRITICIFSIESCTENRSIYEIDLIKRKVLKL